MSVAPLPKNSTAGPWPGEDPTACPRCGKGLCEGDCHESRQVRRARERQEVKARARCAVPEACTASDAPPVVDSAAVFLAKAQNAPTWVIPDLLPEKGWTMFNGRPRSYKSLAALALVVDASLGRPVFGIDKWQATSPLRCLYLGEEDAHGLTAARLGWMLAGHDASAPDNLWLSARKGLNIETAEGQGIIYDIVTKTQAEVLVIDTIRAFASSIDKGPADAADAIRFLRKLLAQTCLRTGVTVAHDTKPTRDGKDERPRAEKASGGAILAAIDCPIGFERLGDRAAGVVPDRFKVGPDPAAFRLNFESATRTGEPFRDWLRATAVAATVTNAKAAALDDAVCAWVVEHPRQSQNNVVKGVEKKRNDVVAALERLFKAGRLDHVKGKRNAILWFPTAPGEQSRIE